MRKSIFTLVLVPSLVTLAPLVSAERAFAQTAYSVSANIGNFHVAVANYYQVPEREVIVIRERRIPDDEIPVALFIARHAGVPWGRVVDMRMRGDSWWDISVRLGVRPDVYYVPVTVVSGPPYGRALGHYKNKHRKQWSTIVLSDADMVNLVELQFLRCTVVESLPFTVQLVDRVLPVPNTGVLERLQRVLAALLRWRVAPVLVLSDCGERDQ